MPNKMEIEMETVFRKGPYRDSYQFHVRSFLALAQLWYRVPHIGFKIMCMGVRGVG